MKDRIVGIETEYGILPILSNDFSFHRFIENGGKVYLETAGNHPEYAAPECIGPTAAALYDAAGDILMNRLFEGSGYELHRLNADEDGTHFGSHENYSVPNELMKNAKRIGYTIPFIAPFLVTRQIFAGAGYYFHGEFRVSQRSNAINFLRSLETHDRRRAIVNEKNEPHASTCARLHLILGDSNMCEYANALKLATTCMVLDMAEEHLEVPIKFYDPVEALHNISGFEWVVTANNGTIHAVDVQRLYLDMARRFYGRADLATSYYLDEWERVLDVLKEEPRSLAGELEWPTKLAILDGLDEEDRFDAHLRWHNIDPKKSLYHELRRKGEIRTCFDEKKIKRASHYPPQNTRAYLRGKFVRRFPRDGEPRIVIDWTRIGSLEMPDPFDTYERYISEMDKLVKGLL
ncbi:MAG: proteasome accessory factor PafA2 family protein [Candidatus Aenigmarchaeota archaeon]|nr:proteasome accessory factor PafA2 family protein [Candidatus Aenigmarchaeota archaeon]